MPVFKVSVEGFDLCGNSWDEGKSWFVEADKIEDIRAVFPEYRGFTKFNVIQVSVMPLSEAVIDAKNRKLL